MHRVHLHDLGWLHDRKWPVRQDHIKAYKWYYLALLGHRPRTLEEKERNVRLWIPDAKRNLARIAEEMTPEDIANVKELLSQWLKSYRHNSHLEKTVEILEKNLSLDTLDLDTLDSEAHHE